MSADDWIALRNNIMKDQGHLKYDVLPMALDDEDKLEDTYNLEMKNRKTRSHFTKYDVASCFTYFVRNDENNPEKVEDTDDLLTSFAKYTPDQVAENIFWMREWIDDDELEDNLLLSYGYFENNSESQIWATALERYDTCPPEKRGGPLFFVIMMHLLLSCTEEAARVLTKRLKSFRIDSLKGEDVHVWISRVRSAIRRLNYVKKLPLDLMSILLNGLQTSSVEAFNDLFKGIKQSQKTSGLFKDTKDRVLNNNALLELASTEYVEMCEAGTWNGVTTPGTGAAALNVTSGGPKRFTRRCFNCGEDHNVAACPKAKDQARIEANKKKFAEQKKRDGGGGKPGGKDANRTGGPKRKWKWRPPERNEHGKREIDGKIFVWTKETRRWTPEGGANPNKPGANLAIPKSDASSITASSGATDQEDQGASKDKKRQQVQVYLTNVSKQMNDSLKGLADLFTQE